MGFPFGSVYFDVNVAISAKPINQEIENLVKVYNVIQKDHTRSRDRIQINITRNTPEILSNNPKTHHEIENGFGMKTYFGWVYYARESGNTKGTVTYIPAQNILRRNHFFKWIIDKEFRHPYQKIPQVMHEIIFIPSILLLSKTLIPLHSSAVFDTKNEKLVVFSGSGGVGKTFLEMSFILKDNFQFFSDDILIVDDKLQGYVNLNWPKIYKYNVNQLPRLNRYVTSGILDKLHWGICQFNPIVKGGCRRKINPLLFRDENTPTVKKIDEIYLLFNERTDTIHIDPLDPEIFGMISLEIIKSEYKDLFTHLNYHKFNRLSLGSKPVYELSQIGEKFIEILKKNKRVSIYIVRIPYGTPPAELYRTIKRKIIA